MKLTKKEVFDTKYIYFIVIIIYVDIQVRLYEMNAYHLTMNLQNLNSGN